MHSYYEITPSLENYWRGVILFGRNVASYKFALAKSLIELSDAQKTFITLEELTLPFSRHLIDHTFPALDNRMHGRDGRRVSHQNCINQVTA